MFLDVRAPTNLQTRIQPLFIGGRTAWMLQHPGQSTTNATIVSDCQTSSGQIPGDQPEQGIDGYGGNTLEKIRVLRQEWKTPWEISASGPGSEHDDGEELGDDDAPDW